MGRTDSLEKTLIQGKTKGRRQSGKHKMKLLGGITDLMNMSLSKLRELVMNRETWHTASHDIEKSWIWLRLNWANVQKTSGSRQKSLGSSQACGPGGSGERFRWRGRIPILLCRCLNPRQGAQDFEYVTKFFFLTKQNKQTCFLQEWELWLSLFSRFYWGMWKESGVGWVCKNYVTSCWRARLMIDILH